MFRQLRGEGNNQVKDYTHIIRVEYNPETMTQIGFIQNITGNLVPSYFNDINSRVSIKELLTNDAFVAARKTTWISFNEPISANKIYLGRADTKWLMEKDGVIDQYRTLVTWTGLGLFTIEEDINKDIPIWLSTTPPPWYEDPNGHAGDGAQIG